MVFRRSSLLLDDEIGRLRLGRYAGEEGEEKRLLSSADFKLRLPGRRNVLGPNIGTWLGMPALRTSRASLDGRRPFTLIHSTVAKGGGGAALARKDRVYFRLTPGDVAAARTLGGAAADASGWLTGGALRWQRSVKRWWAPRGSPGAARVAARFTVAPAPARAPAPTAKPRGAGAAHQRYIERDGAAEISEGTVCSVGTIGDDGAERAAFWNAVEARERADGRVQCRIIAELPHALSPAGRRRIVDDFLELFAERGLAVHVVIHRPDHARAPERGGDPRNVHLHVVYHDRPATRERRGLWRFAAKKDRGARGAPWIRTLRARYADACNRALAREGRRQRFDPRSYAALGIDKVPQLHLGPVMAAFERQGRVTRRGAINLVCEREWERRQELVATRDGARAVAGALERLIAAPNASGPASAAARRRFTARVMAFADAGAGVDGGAVEAAIAARDRVGRRLRAHRLRDHASAPRRRGDPTDRRRWVEIAQAAAAFLESYSARPDSGTSLARRAREAGASERRFRAERLIERRAAITAALAMPGERRPTRAEWEDTQAAAARTAARARHRVETARGELAAALSGLYTDPVAAADGLVRAVEAGRHPHDVVRLEPGALGSLQREPTAPDDDAVAVIVRRLLKAEAGAHEAEAEVRSMRRIALQGRLRQVIETPERARARRAERRRRLRELNAIDLEIVANPTALRRVQREGLAEEIERRARAAERRRGREARQRG